MPPGFFLVGILGIVERSIGEPIHTIHKGEMGRVECAMTVTDRQTRGMLGTPAGIGNRLAGSG
jgi:hypothetical protein